MRARAVPVHLRARDVPVLRALLKELQQLRSALHFALLDVVQGAVASPRVAAHLQLPSTPPDGQQVHEVLLVELDEMRAHGVTKSVRVQALQNREQELHGPRHDAPLLSLPAIHRVRLAGTSLPVRQHCDVVAIDGALHKVVNLTEDLVLLRRRPEDGVELKRLLLAAGDAFEGCHGTKGLHREGVAPRGCDLLTLVLGLQQRPDPAEDTHLAFHIQQKVVASSALVLLVPEKRLKRRVFRFQR
mmetsp:Transcript_61725/g.172414  ORF Transcript_61725/g.172414 Transcript_61725/m.172414 type:complete len:244 (+) Transcript_61725:715-1446(+)